VYLYYIDPLLNEKGKASPIAGFTKQKGEPVFDTDKFFPYVVKHIKDYNHNTRLLTFYTPNGEAANLPVASALLVQPADEKGPKEEKDELVIRPYTPISDFTLPGEFTLMIKKYDGGKLTPHIFSLKKGDKLAMKGPIRKWDYKSNEFSHVGLIGGGSGITPLYQVVNHALRDPNNTTKFTLLFGNVSEKDILLKEEFDGLKKKHPNNFDVVYFVDKSDGSGGATQGYITKDVISKHFDPSLGAKIKIFVCGPPPQVNAISGPKKGFDQGELGGALKELGFKQDQVYKF
jgi:cytochrome-b5 reductase